MKLSFIFSTLLICSILISIVNCKGGSEWEPLFNGENLDNWEKNIGSSVGPDFDDLAESATVKSVFSVVNDDGINLIRISGEINGALATIESFENYHLRMDFKWGDAVYSRRNSGLLYHSFGEFGINWMPNIEFQMGHTNVGDTRINSNTTCETEIKRDEENNEYIYLPGGELITFGQFVNRRTVRKSADNENPVRMWNTLELYCLGRTAVHVVNGMTVMVNTNTGIFVEGDILPLTSGRIQIQSEGAELFVRNIDIRSITEIPEAIIPE